MGEKRAQLFFIIRGWRGALCAPVCVCIVYIVELSFWRFFAAEVRELGTRAGESFKIFVFRLGFSFRFV